MKNYIKTRRRIKYLSKKYRQQGIIKQSQKWMKKVMCKQQNKNQAQGSLQKVSHTSGKS